MHTVDMSGFATKMKNLLHFLPPHNIHSLATLVTHLHLGAFMQISNHWKARVTAIITLYNRVEQKTSQNTGKVTHTGLNRNRNLRVNRHWLTETGELNIENTTPHDFCE